MGNNPSTGSRCTSRQSFRRSTGTLGLSKTELDARCKPTGLYESCKWEQRHVRRVVGDGRLAARLKGTEARVRDSDQECPICFLHYTDINMLQCCSATICTECYLQVQEPPRSQSPPTPCPFCNHDRIEVRVAKKLDGEDVARRDEEEQIVIEATIRARGNSICSDVNSVGSSASKRVCTPDERQNLEEEMRSQSAHPMITQIRRREEEQRDTHDREYRRRSGGQGYSMFQREFLMRQGMDALNNLDDDEAGGNRRTLGGSARQTGRPGNGGLNDLFLIEAALLLSMRNERGGGSSSRSLDATSSAGTATSASATSAGDNSTSNNDTSVRNPLIRALMQQRGQRSSRGSGEEDRFNNSSPWEYPDRNLDPLVRSGFLGEGFPSYSDDDQMAMAIAMSLREEEASQERIRNEQLLRDADASRQVVLDDQSLDGHPDVDDAMGNGTQAAGESEDSRHSRQHPQAQDSNSDDRSTNSSGHNEGLEAASLGDTTTQTTS